MVQHSGRNDHLPSPLSAAIQDAIHVMDCFYVHVEVPILPSFFLKNLFSNCCTYRMRDFKNLKSLDKPVRKACNNNDNYSSGDYSESVVLAP